MSKVSSKWVSVGDRIVLLEDFCWSGYENLWKVCPKWKQDKAEGDYKINKGRVCGVIEVKISLGKEYMVKLSCNTVDKDIMWFYSKDYLSNENIRREGGGKGVFRGEKGSSFVRSRFGRDG